MECRWTKASEKFLPIEPHVDGLLHLRFDGKKIKDVKFLSDGFEIDTGNKLLGFYKKDLHRLEWLSESIEPCATSLENYWKQRCEAAEEIYRMLNLGQIHPREYIAWEKLKSQTPSPTGDRDCEELKKEVERLKDGIQDTINWLQKNRPTMTGTGAPISILTTLLHK